MLDASRRSTLPDETRPRRLVPKILDDRRWMVAKLFDRLVIAAVDAKPLTFKELTTGAK